MEPTTGAPSTSAAVASCLDSTAEYLLLEMIRYYSAGQDHVAAVHAVETMGFRIGSQLAERYELGLSSSAAVRASACGCILSRRSTCRMHAEAAVSLHPLVA